MEHTKASNAKLNKARNDGNSLSSQALLIQISSMQPRCGDET